MASVWLARDESNGTEVAVKMLHPRLRPRALARARVEREAALLTRLEHPHIARALGLVLDVEEPWFAMELVPGPNVETFLGKKVEQGESLSLAWVTTVLAQMTGAVGYAHAQGIIHRDLKPANVMVGAQPEEPSVRVLDFGLAKVLDQGTHKDTTQGRRVGSIAYMSPEQARGDRVDGRTDVFSLGVIGFELLTGRRCWAVDESGRPVPARPGRVPVGEQNNVPAVLDRIASGQRPKLTAERPELPEALDTWFEKAVHPSRTHRFSSVEALFRGFEAALNPAQSWPGSQLLAEVEEDPTVAAPSPKLDAFDEEGDWAQSSPLDSGPEATRVTPRSFEVDDLEDTHALAPLRLAASPLEPSSPTDKTAVAAWSVRPMSPKGRPGPRHRLRYLVIGAVLGGAFVGGAMLAVLRPPGPFDPAVRLREPSRLPRTLEREKVHVAPSSALSKRDEARAARLRQLLQAVRVDPENAERGEDLRQALFEVAATLESAERRATVLRLIEASSLTGDVDGFAEAVAIAVSELE